jgi:hypothetical protein
MERSVPVFQRNIFTVFVLCAQLFMMTQQIKMITFFKADFCVIYYSLVLSQIIKSKNIKKILRLCLRILLIFWC